MIRILFIQKYVYGMKGRDLPRKMFLIFLNGFTGEKMQVKEESGSDWLWQERSLNAKTERYGRKICQKEAHVLKFGSTVTEKLF